MPYGVAQDIFQGLGRSVQITAYPTVRPQQAWQPRGWPIAFETGVFLEHVPQRLNLNIFDRQRRPFGIQPSQLKAVLDQALHRVDLSPKPFTQLRQILFAVTGHAQTTQGVRSSWDMSRNNCCCNTTVPCKRSDIWSKARPN